MSVVAWTLVACLFSAPLNTGEQNSVWTQTMPPATTTESPKAEVQARVEDLRGGGEAALADLLDTFYAGREYRHAWAQAPALTAARELLVRIAASQEDGLCPMRYEVPWLRNRLAVAAPFSPGNGAVLDVDLSIGLLR